MSYLFLAPCKHPFPFFFAHLIIRHKVTSHCSLNLHFPDLQKFKHLFWVLVIWISFSENCPFVSFAFCSIGQLVFFSPEFMSSLYVIEIFVIYTVILLQDGWLVSFPKTGDVKGSQLGQEDHTFRCQPWVGSVRLPGGYVQQAAGHTGEETDLGIITFVVATVQYSLPTVNSFPLHFQD